MNWIRRHRPSPTTAIALAALVVALGGVAFAAIPDSNGTIHACYEKKSGDLRVVGSARNCRNGETALAWNKRGPQGPPGESSGLKVLPSLTLGPGERQLLFEAGSLTFTAFCEAPDPNSIRSIVEVTTSQDHAAVVEDFERFARRDLLVGETASIVGTGSTLTEPGIADVDFTATSPDRTVVTGIFSLGQNLGNDPGKCLIGGHAAISR